MTHHDLVIIGTGSGNSLVTPDFAGRSVAIIEEGVFGGTCLNVGCIPTKMFVLPADRAEQAHDAARLGVDAHVDRVRWADVRDRVFGRIDPISDSGRDYRVGGPGTTAYLGHATFTGDRTLSVDVDGGPVEVSGDQVVIATGSHPVIPQLIRDSGIPFHTNATIMRIDDLPESLVILGGGFIAAEFAHVFAALGTQVTVINRSDQLLRKEDDEISRAFTELVTDRWQLHLGRTVEAARGDDREVVLTLDDGTTVTAQMLLVATGRAPSTARLGTDAAGVQLHPDGRVCVDEYGRTTADGVWALGDVSSPYQLKHVANHEARVVAHNLAHPDDLRPVDHRFVPSAVFTHPQIAAVGLTEAQARAAGHDVLVKTQRYGDVAYGWALEDTTGLCKVILDAGTKQVLGAHLMGEQAATLIQPLVQAMSFGLDAEQMARGQYWIHPALTEVVENALLGALEQA